MDNELIEIQKNWDAFGKNDPLWAIASSKDKKGRKWKVEDFFQTGINQINNIKNEISRLNLVISHNKALDFGCGVGRITQALAPEFKSVTGVDISPSMLQLANQYNKFGDTVSYQLNANSNLSCFDSSSYDFIFSADVLQHMPIKYQKEYLVEFLRVLSQEGLLVFQLPSSHITLINKLLHSLKIDNFLYRIYGGITNQPMMQYYPNSRKNVESFLLSHGAKKIYAINDPRTTVESYVYIVKK